MIDDYITGDTPITIDSPEELAGDYQPLFYRSDRSGVSVDIITEQGRLSQKMIFSSGSIIVAFRVSELIRRMKLYDPQTFYCIQLFLQGTATGVFIARNEDCLAAMKTPLPDGIVRTMLKEKDPDDIAELEREVILGNIPWRPEFRAMGIENPADSLREGDAILANFDGLLNSYLQFVEVKDGGLTEDIKSSLIMLAKEFPASAPEVIIGGAGIAAYDQWTSSTQEGSMTEIVYGTIRWIHEQGRLTEKEAMDSLRKIIS